MRVLLRLLALIIYVGTGYLIGFMVGCLPAIVLGLAIGLYRPVRAAFDPLISATYPIPKSSLLPLILLILILAVILLLAVVVGILALVVWAIVAIVGAVTASLPLLL